MSVAALVARVGEVLGHGHALFGQPPASGGSAALDAATGLGRAGELVATGGGRMTALSGALPDSYGRFADQTGPALTSAAGADTGLSAQLQQAAGSDRAGRQSSGSVVTAAAADTSALAPTTATAAGQRALINALRTRVAQQQQLITAQQARADQLATMVRSLQYSGGTGRAAGMPMSRAPMGGMPMGGMPMGGMPMGLPSMGGGGLSGSSLSGLAGLTSLGRQRGRGRPRAPHTVLAADVVGSAAAGDVSGAPGQGAAQAALSKLGRPYVWGAKGPNVFDCSGLTQWAWRQAGVSLGTDTYAQIRQGLPVAPNQVRAGDLIFPLDSFGEGGRSGPGHVQMAISPTQVVHAPQTGDVVRVAPMPERFIARRPVRTT